MSKEGNLPFVLLHSLATWLFLLLSLFLRFVFFTARGILTVSVKTAPQHIFLSSVAVYSHAVIDKNIPKFLGEF